MLMDIGFSSVDQGNVYRTLRKLEKKTLFLLLGTQATESKPKEFIL